MSKPNGAWCSRHRPRKHESQLSPRLSRDVKWYRRERDRWIAFLGGKCAECGDTEELEFQHDAPRDWVANKTSRWQRLRNYIRDIKAGRITRLLCRSCNAAAGRPKGESEVIEAAGKCKKAHQSEPF